MNLRDVVSYVDINNAWRDNYKYYVPKFITEAIKNNLWQDWEHDIWNEYFEKSAGQCVSSLQQGYFSNNEKEQIKENWDRIAPLLKKIAESQDIQLFEVYEELKNEIYQHTDNYKESAVNRMIAGLQPNLLTTVITYKYLNELHKLLTQKCHMKIDNYTYTNWFKDSNLILNIFKTALPGIDAYDMVTYPWDTLEFLRKTDINQVSRQMEQEKLIQLLKYKKQIILQGPPGTGKTKLAKEIARELTLPGSIAIDDIKRLLKVGQVIYSISDLIPYKVETINDNGISLKLENGNLQTRNYDHIIQAYSNLLLKNPLTGGDAYQAAIAKYIMDNWEDERVCKVIQFHPSYSYEDFVRGIVAESKGDKIEYTNVNKIFGLLAKDALENYELSKQENTEVQIDKWISESFNDFKSEIEKDIEEKEIKLSGNIGIFALDSTCFRYGKEWGTPSRLNFTDFRKVIKATVTGKLKPEQNNISKEISIHAHYRSTYYLALLRIFFNKYQFTPSSKRQEQKNYVLIIDEINRANLSSVLGELIYALEYRGEKVESMYEVDDSNELILPPNLYIIGTMNTADRSVGHIDYAIRRRFAFVDILPEVLPDNFETELFKKVSTLFVKDISASKLESSQYLSSEFRPQDVCIGHSYFIKKENVDSKIRLKYEILPILEEYIRDGVLKESKELREILDNLEREIS